MKRKTLLNTLGIGAAVLTAVGSYLGYQANVTPAEREVRNFPRQVEGARSIEKSPTGDAQYVLVHIKQKHMLPFESEKDTGNSALDVLTCQKDIYTILDSRIKSGKLAEIYSEGLAQEYEKIRNTVSPELESRMLALNKEQRKAFYERMFLSEGGAAQVISLERRIPLRAAENLELNKKGLKELGEARERAHEAVRKMNADLKEENIVAAEQAINLSEKTLHKYREPREDYALSSIAGVLQKENKVLAYLVYGGGHDFKDNIERWNKEHPNSKFSLIVITPTSYKGQDK